MNKFDEFFFSRYLRDGEEPLEVCHRHIVSIIDTVILWLFFAVIMPAFFYYNNTFTLQTLVPFLYFEVYLGLVYILLMYKIFDWYNDVWILTEKGLIDLDWTAFKKNLVYIEFKDIKGIEIRQSSMWDGFLNRGTIEVFLEGEDDAFVLDDAYSPDGVVSYIQDYIEEKAKKKKQVEKQSFEVLLDTLQKVVRNHLENPPLSKENENGDDEDASPETKDEDLEKALKKK